jgi:hypothetical protein
VTKIFSCPSCLRGLTAISHTQLFQCLPCQRHPYKSVEGHIGCVIGGGSCPFIIRSVKYNGATVITP